MTSAFIEKFDFLIVNSRAYRNSLFSDFDPSQLGVTNFNVICANYRTFTNAFPDILANLVKRVSDNQLRALLVEILHSELGQGEHRRAHSVLFLDFWKSSPHFRDSAPLRSSEMFVESLRQLFSEEPVLVGLGAQYALEHQAQNMLHQLKRLLLLSSAMNERELDTRFFEIHEIEEPDHIDLMTIILNRLVDERNEPMLLLGAERCCALFGAYWDSIADSFSVTDGSRED